MTASAIVKRLKQLSNPANVEGMKRFGISSQKTFGVSIPGLREIAKETGKNHKLAIELWNTGYHEARILASMIDVPKEVTDAQIEKWVKDFDSWDVCDQCCSNLFDKTPSAYEKINKWSKSKDEFIKRAAFSLLAVLAVHDKKADDKKFMNYFPVIKRESTDERNYVRKAVNWALRQIGKRNRNLYKEAIRLAKEIMKIENKTARWIASDALRELESEKVKIRIPRK